MAASRARWPVTASSTGRGGRAAPALLKWRTLATPGVSALSEGTSSVMATSWPRVEGDRGQAILAHARGRVAAGRAEGVPCLGDDGGGVPVRIHDSLVDRGRRRPIADGDQAADGSDATAPAQVRRGRQRRGGEVHVDGFR